MPSGKIAKQPSSRRRAVLKTTSRRAKIAAALAAERDRIRAANRRSDFVDILPASSASVQFCFYSITTLPASLQDWAFDLVSINVKDFYDRDGPMSWSDEGKRAEMSSKSSRYLFALDRTSQTPLGFVHFQFVMEDCTDGGPYLPQQAAIYCYELQIAESQQGKGIGRQLLDAMEHIGRDTGMRKAMLTTFKSNDRATRFYAHLGYERDGISPDDASYEIMCKRLCSSSASEQ